jgi:hypothetical protein
VSSLELSDQEQAFLAEVMRALETERPGWLFVVQPSVAEDVPELDVLWIDVTRVLEGVPQEPTVRNPVSRITINDGDVEALARGMAPAIIGQLDPV